jgi:hypothetical protein
MLIGIILLCTLLITVAIALASYSCRKAKERTKTRDYTELNLSFSDLRESLLSSPDGTNHKPKSMEVR